MDIDLTPLSKVAHYSREDGVSALGFLALMAGEEHTDRPKCACPVIAAFVRRWSYELPDDDTRNRLLKPVLPRLIGTRAGDGVAWRRAVAVVDWFVREYIPTWLDLVPALAQRATDLRGIPEIADRLTARQAGELLVLVAADVFDVWVAAAATAIRRAVDGTRFDSVVAVVTRATSAIRIVLEALAWVEDWADAGGIDWPAERGIDTAVNGIGGLSFGAEDVVARIAAAAAGWSDDDTRGAPEPLKEKIHASVLSLLNRMIDCTEA